MFDMITSQWDNLTLIERGLVLMLVGLAGLLIFGYLF
jgi:hypothetical protein